jgi:hypothetical protein
MKGRRFLGGLLFGVSCAAAALSARDARALPSYIIKTGNWTQSAFTATPLIDANNNYCWLTAVSGKFVGGGESVHVFTSNGTWLIGGSSLQTGVSGSAKCLAHIFLRTEQGGTIWTNSFSANTGIVGGSSCSIIGCIPPVPGIAQTNAWQGDAALMISGITGQFNGGGEAVTAEQAGNPWAFNVLFVGAQSFNGVGGWAQALFVGIPQSGFVPSFYGPNGGPLTANDAGEYSASAYPGKPALVRMAPAEKAFCYFTEISGAFAGAGETVEIVTETVGEVEYWSLDVASGQSNGTFAKARCYAIDQSASLVQ